MQNRKTPVQNIEWYVVFLFVLKIKDLLVYLRVLIILDEMTAHFNHAESERRLSAGTLKKLVSVRHAQ